jgi:hypothetical protein
MRQTHTYTSEHYVRDNGFPLAWMFRCCISRDMVPAEVEAAENHERAVKARQGKVIGKPVLSGQTGPRRVRTRDWERDADGEEVSEMKGSGPGPEVETVPLPPGVTKGKQGGEAKDGKADMELGPVSVKTELDENVKRREEDEIVR